MWKQIHTFYKIMRFYFHTFTSLHKRRLRMWKIYTTSTLRSWRQLNFAPDGMELVQKVDKIYLGNTCFIYALADENPEIENIRETFFYCALCVNNKVTASPDADFLVGGHTFEVGGKSKKQKQIKGRRMPSWSRMILRTHTSTSCPFGHSVLTTKRPWNFPIALLCNPMGLGLQ